MTSAFLNHDRFPVDPWRLVESRYSDQDPGVTETLFAVANGYLGLRGNHPEGWQAHEHGTFVNGFHETFPIRHAENAYGFAEVGQTIINAPDAKVMRVYVDDDLISLDVAELREYRRELDFRDGVLRRELVWQTPSGKRVRIEMERLVSFPEKHLAIQTMTVTVLGSDAPVTISSQLVNRQDGGVIDSSAPAFGAGFDPRRGDRLGERVLVPQQQWQEGTRLGLSYRAASSGMTLAVVADHLMETENDYTHRMQVEADLAKNVFRVQAKADVPTRLVKVISYHTSRGVPAEELIERARRSLDRALLEGVDAIVAAQRQWLDEFWARSDVRIEGHDELQLAVRWCLFLLAKASARADSRGIPAKGLTGSGYSGHYFWDTEIYVMPFLGYTNPLWARNAMRMRILMLPKARRRARQLNEAGALFPWRTINGEEASAYYAAGTAQYHINADIVHALAKYVRATGDIDFLHRQGVDVVVETARLWATLGFWRTQDDGTDTFHIHGVTGPDEYTTVVNDNLFTNVMARFNLRFAARVVRRLAETDPAAYRELADRVALDPDEVRVWEHVSDAICIPRSDALGIHPQDAQFLEREVWDLENTPLSQRPLLLHFHPLVIYRFQVLKQADVVLALFLQGDQFTAGEKRADFDYYDPLTTGDSTLSAVVQSILAAEVGYRELALRYFHDALFVDLGNLHHNSADGVHVASAGGVWTALVQGFGGMRDYEGRLSFDPRLPEVWPSLQFPLAWRGSSLLVTVTADELRVEVTAGGPVSFTVRGEPWTAAAGSPAIVALDGQGPDLPGRPTLRRFAGATRDDGTVLEPTVPQVAPAAITDTLPVITADMLAAARGSEDAVPGPSGASSGSRSLGPSETFDGSEKDVAGNEIAEVREGEAVHGEAP